MSDALSPEVPEDYLKQVKEILDHLYDYPYLQNHAWARPFLDEGLTPQQAGQQLRRRFVDAIDTLNPDRVIFFREPEARLYNLLHLYYVEGFSIVELTDELNLSRRQIYRDLKRGQHTVAKLLYAQDEAPTKTSEPATSLSDVTSLEQELSQLQYNFHLVDMCQLMRDAINSVMPLCRQKDIQFRSSVPSRAIHISTDKAIAEQVLVNILSQIIVQIAPASIDVSLQENEDKPVIAVAYAPVSAQDIDFSALSQLTKQLDWSVRHSTQAERETVSILPRAGAHTIMVIDDNQALLQLLQRYLSNHRCQVLTVPNGEKGWALLQEAMPDALIMDVMMPELDGWELLQRIRSNPVT
ncbi:MAG: response regulator [Chloroflexi bacterium]|nr:response regulator [Chloroflexota bacterium]